MRLIFFGTADFAVPALRALAKAEEVIAAVCAPDAVGKRGMKTIIPPLKRAAMELNIPVTQPPTPAGAIELVKSEKPDALVVAAYGRILPRALLRLPKYGALNIHPSLLPRWRGAAPIERAILAGDCDTGVTVMQMDCGLDSGAMLRRETIPIRGDAGEMRVKLAALGARLIVRALREPAEPIPQSDAAATYAARIDKSEAAIRWTNSAAQIARQVKAFSPTPGAFALLNQTRIKIFAAHPAMANRNSATAAKGEAIAAPGAILAVTAEGIIVACGGKTKSGGEKKSVVGDSTTPPDSRRFAASPAAMDSRFRGNDDKGDGDKSDDAKNDGGGNGENGGHKNDGDKKEADGSGGEKGNGDNNDGGEKGDNKNGGGESGDEKSRDKTGGEESGEVLVITRLQRPGGKTMSAAEFCRGYNIAVGQQFAAPPPAPSKPPKPKAGLVFTPKTATNTTATTAESAEAKRSPAATAAMEPSPIKAAEAESPPSRFRIRR